MGGQSWTVATKNTVPQWLCDAYLSSDLCVFTLFGGTGAHI